VNRVVAVDALDRVVEQWAAQLAAAAPVAVALTKRLLDEATSPTLEQVLEDEARAQALSLASDDFREAIRARRKKRPPTFAGR
jgi:2-(1,2-epoxy-1,2-dihydrophenyl)acetyl-CoA isomerase